MIRTNSLARRRFELMAAEYLERIGARIAARREELGLTQEDVARELPGKVTGQRVSLWERGKHRPRDDSLEALARILRVDVSYFMSQEPEKQNGTPDLFAGESDQPQLVAIESKLDALTQVLAENNRLLRALAVGPVPLPSGELGRVLRGHETTPPTEKPARRQAGRAARSGNAG